ncbi:MULTISPECIES: DUF3397 domain-containing protein [unclassified Lacticaseibacillus]|uniref:DUF3397 domain-containing protein n=1 Tax=unclassified Lacticaseibacillus TaxID=2759744 RepID=UPI00194596C0|nr:MULTISPECIES: DUF3397 domain-containing protein [unclassified Lacticaseibacillus]
MLIGIILPLAGLALWSVSRALQFHSRVLPFLVVALDLLGVASLAAAKAPNTIWVALFTTTAIAILLIIYFLAHDYDLLFARYFTTLGRVLLLAATFWWLGAILLSL